MLRRLEVQKRLPGPPFSLFPFTCPPKTKRPSARSLRRDVLDSQTQLAGTISNWSARFGSILMFSTIPGRTNGASVTAKTFLAVAV